MHDTEYYLESADPEAIHFAELDCAIVGNDHKGNLVYSYELMIEKFISDGMEYEDAIEWIDYNVVQVNAGTGFTIIYQ
jgi:hypothetical protein